MTTTEGTAAPERTHRGIQHLMHPQVIGALIGASGASVFVHANRGAPPGSWSTVAVAVWAAALLVWGWAVLLRPRRLSDARPAQRAGLVYVASVAGMLVTFAVGRRVLDAVERPELMPAVIVIGVGLHFVPFARSFSAPVFGVLGWTLAAIGVAGLLLGLVGGAVPVAAAAVVTGVVMLLLIALDAVRDGQANASTS